MFKITTSPIDKQFTLVQLLKIKNYNNKKKQKDLWGTKLQDTESGIRHDQLNTVLL